MQESGRTRAAGRAAVRDLFEQVRMRYFRLPPAARRALYAVILIGAVGTGAALGWDLLNTFLTTAVILCFVALTLRFPQAAATALVVAGWLALLPVFASLFPAGSLAPTLPKLPALPVAVP